MKQVSYRSCELTQALSVINVLTFPFIIVFISEYEVLTISVRGSVIISR